MYHKDDLAILKSNISTINNKLKIFRYNRINHNERKDIIEIIFKFIRDNNLKIYGGYCLNLLLDKSIYDKYDIFDIDIYTPQPIKHCTEIVDTLSEKYENVCIKEAMHKETFSLYINYEPYADITYMPYNIFNNLKFTKIDNIYCTDSHFIIIDYFRILNDPISYWKIEKTFERLIKLEQKYMFPKINIMHLSNTNSNKFLNNIIKKVLIDDIFVGAFAYSKIYKQIYNKKIYPEFIEVLILNNYEEKIKKLIAELKYETNDYENFRIEEYYPFFQFTNNFVKIYNKDKLILIVYNCKNKCYYASKIKKIFIGNFSLCMLYAIINMNYHKIYKNKIYKEFYYNIISSFIQLRNIFFHRNKDKNIINSDFFTEFNTNCMGDTIIPEKERALRIQLRKNKKLPYIFRYEKGNCVNNLIYHFENTSGNIINDDNDKLFINC